MIRHKIIPLLYILLIDTIQKFKVLSFYLINVYYLSNVKKYYGGCYARYKVVCEIVPLVREMKMY